MRLPDNIYLNNCKIFHQLYKNKFTLDVVNTVHVGSKGSNMKCKYQVITATKDVVFSYYDAVVLDAIYTIYKMDYSKFTLTDLIRVMAVDEKVRFYCTKDGIQKREQRLRDCVHRLMYTSIIIDYSEEVKLRELKDDDGKPLKGEIQDYLAPIVEEENGRVFWFLEGRELPIYKYAESIRQIICVPREMLSLVDLGLNFSNTDEIILLKRILLQRLEIMKNSKNNMDGRTIRYYGIKPEEGIFPMADIHKENFAKEEKFVSDRGTVRFESRSWKNKVHTINQKICAILDAYKKCGYLADYKLIRNEPRGLVRGVEIEIK